MDKILNKLKELGFNLPETPRPIANYLPYKKLGKQIFVSGQLPIKDGVLMAVGRVGDNVSLNDAKKAAQFCAVNIIAQLCNAKEDFQSLQLIKLNVFVCVNHDFTDIAEIANGASDLFVKIFGERGKHARSAVGVYSLPLGAVVEIEAIFESE